jgi:hypothetical protein
MRRAGGGALTVIINTDSVFSNNLTNAAYRFCIEFGLHMVKIMFEVSHVLPICAVQHDYDYRSYVANNSNV